jgi:type III secretory pathway component EscV
LGLDAFGMVETLQRIALGLIVLWPSLATVVVALRVYTRISMKRFSLGKFSPTMETWTHYLITAPTDDYTIFIA